MTLTQSLLLGTAILALLAWFGRRQAAPTLQGGALSPPKPSSGETVIVGSYNIHRARGTDGNKNLQRIADTLAKVDVAGLCECEGPRSFFAGQDQCTKLGQRLQLSAIFSPTQKRWGRYDRGNGLLSRLPISGWQQEPLADSTGTHPRSLLRADIRLGTKTIPLFVTHLARRLDQATQLKTVMARFTACESAILVGDFNLNADSPLLRPYLLNAKHTDAIADGDPARIDWILCKGFEVIDSGSSPVGASDHPFYWVELKPII